MRLPILGLLLGLLGTTLAGPAAPARALEPGDPAPDFLVPDVQGGPAIHMSEYRGKVVLLAFFWVY
jgi:hypothetical protein